MQIAIIGTGNVGGNLGIRLSAWGHDLRFGVRRGKDVSQLLSRCGGGARALPIEEACRDADPIFLTVPAAAAVDAVRAAGDISGQTVVDCANPVAFRDGPIWSPPPEGSITAALAQHFPGVRFVKGFSTFGAEFHLDPTLDGTGIDVQLAGDDPAAKEMVAGLAQAPAAQRRAARSLGGAVDSPRRGRRAGAPGRIQAAAADLSGLLLSFQRGEREVTDHHLQLLPIGGRRTADQPEIETDILQLRLGHIGAGVLPGKCL